MKDKYTWLWYYCGSIVQRYWNTLMVVTKTDLLLSSRFKKPLITCDAVNKYIADCIENHIPTMVSRFGCFESRCMGQGYGIEYGWLKTYTQTALKPIYNNAGVFPYGKDGAQNFFELTKDAIEDIDLLGVWTTEMHDYLVNVKCPSAMQITNLDNLEPFRSESTWTKALAGKRVVVVHPFKDTIEMQYGKREYLFENPDMLPEFNLRVVKAVQTIAGQKDDRFEKWEQALQYMYGECMKEDFDVAIIGCGAYGMPLASMLKRAGKVAIHVGGATQVMFGIKGKRWDNNSISGLYNSYWVRPMESDTPQNASSVEKGCYW